MSEKDKKEGFIVKGIRAHKKINVKKSYREDADDEFGNIGKGIQAHKKINVKKSYREDSAASTKKLSASEKDEIFDNIYGQDMTSVTVADEFGNNVTKCVPAKGSYNFKNTPLTTADPNYIKNEKGFDSSIENERVVTQAGLTDYLTKNLYNCLGWAISDALETLSRHDKIIKPVTEPGKSKLEEVLALEKDLIDALDKIGCKTVDFAEADLEKMEKEVDASKGSKYLIAMRTNYSYHWAADTTGKAKKKNEGWFAQDYHFAKYAYNQGWTHKLGTGELYHLDKYSDSIWLMRNAGHMRTKIQQEGHKVSRPRAGTVQIAVSFPRKVLWALVEPSEHVVRVILEKNSLVSGTLKGYTGDKKLCLYTGENAPSETDAYENVKCDTVTWGWDSTATAYRLSWSSASAGAGIGSLTADCSIYTTGHISGTIKENEPVDFVYEAPSSAGTKPWVRKGKVVYLNVVTNMGVAIQNFDSDLIKPLLEDIVRKKLGCNSTIFMNGDADSEVIKLLFDVTRCENNILNYYSYDSPTKFVMVYLDDEDKLMEAYNEYKLMFYLDDEDKLMKAYKENKLKEHKEE